MTTRYSITRAELDPYLALLDAFVERFGRHPVGEETAKIVADARAIAAADAIPGS